MRATVRLGRVAGILVGAHWSALVGPCDTDRTSTRLAAAPDENDPGRRRRVPKAHRAE